MMEALKVMTYFKVSLSTHNWDRAIKNGSQWLPFFISQGLGLTSAP